MKAKKILLYGLILAGTLTVSCRKMLDPENDNHAGDSRLLTDPAFAEGLLLNGYTGLLVDYAMDETATDDAVTNDYTSNYLKMATGAWATRFDPVSIWDKAYTEIYYLNSFLDIVNQVPYSNVDLGAGATAVDRNILFAKRFTGEALALRAWYNFELLKRHGGIGSDNSALGFIILQTKLTKDSDWQIPRDSYDACVKFILRDIDSAIALLPDLYVAQADVNLNKVLGAQNVNRVNGRIARALKSRVLLHVASQSFTAATDKWDNAAIASATLITQNGGAAGLSATGLTWWKTLADKDIIWRRDFVNANSLEINNFPPSLFGNGQTNPTQNLVDAFPMKNGYPIGLAPGGYDVNNPYNGRDPRLAAYIIYNGNNINGTVINTKNEDLTNGLNKTIHSTRTGYYLNKLLIPTVNLNPTILSKQQHFYTFFRYTEIYLNFAEAANEAWGPQGDPKGYGYTASSIISAIRKRAGITQPDNYLASVTTSKDQMRELIRNERRLELCFEGFRFWDMRRWNLNLTETAKGVSITNGKYAYMDVESRVYSPFMVYGPISFTEIQKNNKLLQNKGWNQ